VDFCFPPTTPTPEHATPSHPAIPEHTVSPIYASETEVLDGDRRPYTRSIGFFDLTTHCSANLSGVFACAKEVIDTKVASHDLIRQGSC